MHIPVRWPIRTPVWVWLATFALLSLVAFALFFLSLPMLLLFLLAAVLLRRWLRLSSLQTQGRLSFDGNKWWYAQKGQAERRVSLEQVWPNGVWTTMRFRLESPLGAESTMFELTVWKSVVPARSWRQLGMLVARYAGAETGGRRERT